MLRSLKKMPNGANGTSDPSTPRLPPSSGSCRTTDATRRRGKHRRVRALHGESSTGMALVTRVGARERGQRTSLKSEIKLSRYPRRRRRQSVLRQFGRARPVTSFEEPPQARLVKIAHGRLAAWLNPFGMLPSQVVVNLSLKLGHGVGRVTD